MIFCIWFYYDLKSIIWSVMLDSINMTWSSIECTFTFIPSVSSLLYYCIQDLLMSVLPPTYRIGNLLCSYPYHLCFIKQLHRPNSFEHLWCHFLIYLHWFFANTASKNSSQWTLPIIFPWHWSVGERT